MPFAPPGTVFRNRVADVDGVFYFDCQRSAEHPQDERRCRREFTSRTDRDTFITRHDAAYHDELLAQRLGLVGDTPSLGEIVVTFMQRQERKYLEGQCDRKTLAFYRKLGRRLLKHLGADTPATAIDTRRIMRLDDQMRAEEPRRRRDGKPTEHPRTQGAMVKKAISALGTMYRDFGIAPTWVLRRNAISAAHRPKSIPAVEKIIRFIAAMEPESLERDFCVFKFASGMRNEEIYAASVGDENLKRRELEYRLRNKQTGEPERHVTYLNDEALDVVRRRTKGRPRNAPLFEIDGRRLQHGSLRKRFIAASAAATAAWKKKDPKNAEEIRILSVGTFRARVATEVRELLANLDAIRSQLGHKHEATSERFYIIEDREKKLAKSKAFTAASSELLKPVGRRASHD